MKKWLKSKVVITSLIALVGIAIVVGTLLLTKEEVVAEVGSVKITAKELQASLLSQYGADTLDTLIADKLIELEADKQKVKVSEKEIQSELDTLAESYGGETALEEAVTSSGSTMADVKSDIVSYLQTEKLLEPRINITEDELKAYFEENKETYTVAEQVQASHILVADEATAKEVKSKLDAGEDFAALAKEYSTDTATATVGGDLGYFSKGEMAAEFEDSAFSLAVNEVSNPVKTDYGYHLIKVVDHKQAQDANYENSKSDIKEAILAERMQTEYTTWIEELKEEYKITNHLK